jgi:GntR family transcriptional regulator
MTTADMFRQSGAPYLQVADDLGFRIATGQIPSRLPSERALAQEYCVAYGTIRHAMAVLRQRGLILTRHGDGTYVVSGPGLPGS